MIRRLLAPLREIRDGAADGQKPLNIAGVLENSRKGQFTQPHRTSGAVDADEENL